MIITVLFYPSASYAGVVLHAWEPTGGVWDVAGTLDPKGFFTFSIDTGTTVQTSQLLFKYRFQNPSVVWESDNFIRRIPSGSPATVSTFDFTAQCFSQDPFSVGQPAAAVDFNVLTNRYAGGKVYAWVPGGPSTTAGESARDTILGVSTFHLDVPQPLQGKFYYKLIKPDGTFESDACNRIWLPINGATPWLKSEELDVQPTRIQRLNCPIQVIYPSNLPAAPVIHVEDDISDYKTDYTADTVQAFDPLFNIGSYTIGVFPVSQYLVNAPGEGQVAPRIFSVQPTGAANHKTILFGFGDWFDTVVPRNVPVTFIMHPNPSSAFPSKLAMDVSVDDAPPHETVSAIQQTDGTWQCKTLAFPGIDMKIVCHPQNSIVESRSDGPFNPKRLFNIDATTVFHTVDGIAGLSPAIPSAFLDVSLSDRRMLMSAVFSPAIVAAGIFAPTEMPHGVSYVDQDAWVVVKAPHAPLVELIVLDAAAKTRKSYPMSITSDLRYAWCKLRRATMPPGTLYRFLLNRTVEILDPASKLVNDPGDSRPTGRDSLWPEADESDPTTSPWSISVDVADIRASQAGSAYRTPSWDSLVIYEMHPLRCTNRYSAQPAFDRMISELATGQYIHALPITALELLPTHEFPGNLGWGYNPAFYFATDSSYGGPRDMARAVRASHHAGKAVILDVVYNHMTQSPLQNEYFAKDIYIDGVTLWGDMPNYDHPAAIEFFRQATVYLWDALAIDGFRFDCTKAIVQGADTNNDCIAWDPVFKRKQVGNGGGWEFLSALHDALHRAADAVGRPWPITIAEDSDMNQGFGAPGGALDSEWHFPFKDAVLNSAGEQGDQASALVGNINWPENSGKHFSATIRFGESHDSVSDQQGGRIAHRAPFMCGYRMAKATGAATLLARGIPMFFMGAEGAEDAPFYFDNKYSYDPNYCLQVGNYIDPNNLRNKVYAWFRDLIGLRLDPGKNLSGDDGSQYASRGYRTLSFSRAGGQLFVIATFDTPDVRQNLGWLGLPPNATYKEIFNSSWPSYQVENESNMTNGGYGSYLTATSDVNLPPIGAVVLERR